MIYKCRRQSEPLTSGHAMQSAIVLALVTIASQALCTSAAGLRVSGNNILDGNGNKFVMRGINDMYTWNKQNGAADIAAIARTGANTIRIVLSNGVKFQKDDAASVARILQLCKDNKLIAMLQVTDATGSNNVNDLLATVNYWIELKGVLTGLEDRVIINPANEWHGGTDGRTWAYGYVLAIRRLRSAGLNHLIVVDAAGYGQTIDSVVQYGRLVFNADPKRNTAFSLHLYEVAARDAPTIRNSIDRALATLLAIIVGEFSNLQAGRFIPYGYIMQYCQQRSVGWLAWAWYGNAVRVLDLYDKQRGQLTRFGNRVVNGADGIRATSKLATTWN